MEAYGIDLWDQATKMHWCKFLALFEGIPENCILRQIMGIRAQPITELKALYALPSKTTEEETQNGWDALFNFLERRAKE